LLRSDIRLTPSDIRYASFKANRISLQGDASAISLLRQQKYNAVEDSISLKPSGRAHLLSAESGSTIKRADMEINPYRLFNCPLAPKEKDSAFLYVFFVA